MGRNNEEAIQLLNKATDILANSPNSKDVLLASALCSSLCAYQLGQASMQSLAERSIESNEIYTEIHKLTK